MKLKKVLILLSITSLCLSGCSFKFPFLSKGGEDVNSEADFIPTDKSVNPATSITVIDNNYNDDLLIDISEFDNAYETPTTVESELSLQRGNIMFHYKRLSADDALQIVESSDINSIGMIVNGSQGIYVDVLNNVSCAVVYSDEIDESIKRDLVDFIWRTYNIQSGSESLNIEQEKSSESVEVLSTEILEEDDNPIKDSPEPQIEVGNGAMKSFGLGGSDTTLYQQNLTRPDDVRFDFTDVVDEKFDYILITGKVKIKRGVLEEEYTPEKGRAYLQFPKSQSYELERLESDDSVLNWKYTKQNGTEELNGIFSFGYDLPKGKYTVESGTINVIKNPPSVQFDSNRIQIIPGEVVTTYNTGQEFEVTEMMWVSCDKVKLKE